MLWPDHCQQGTAGCEFAEAIGKVPESAFVVRKGFRKTVDSYSAFFELDRCANPTTAAAPGVLHAACCSRHRSPSLASDTRALAVTPDPPLRHPRRSCTQTGLYDLLTDELRKKDVKFRKDRGPRPGLGRLFIVGLALEVAVRYTAEDAVLLSAAWREDAKAEAEACQSDAATDGAASGTALRSHTSQTPSRRPGSVDWTRAASGGGGGGGGRPGGFGGSAASVPIEEQPAVEGATLLVQAEVAGRGRPAGPVTETLRGEFPLLSIHTQRAEREGSSGAHHGAAPTSPSAAANHAEALWQSKATCGQRRRPLWSQVRPPYPALSSLQAEIPALLQRNRLRIAAAGRALLDLPPLRTPCAITGPSRTPQQVFVVEQCTGYIHADSRESAKVALKDMGVKVSCARTAHLLSRSLEA